MIGSRSRPVLTLALPALVVLLVAAAVSAPAQTTDEEIARIEAELARLQAEALHLTEEYQAAWAADADLEFRISRLQSSIAAYGVEQRRLRDQIRERAVDLYMSGAAGNDLGALMISASLADLDILTAYLDDARERDQVLFNTLELLTRRMEEATETLRLNRQEQQEALARLEELSVDLAESLAAGQEAYRILQERRAEEIARAEAEARAQAEAEFLATSTTTPATTVPATTSEATTTAPTTTATPTTVPDATTTEATTTTALTSTDTTLPPPTTSTTVAPDPSDPPSGSMACPVDGFHSFTDTWGAPRSGGRRHEGVDMLADRGTPVVAVEDGMVDRMGNGGRGGITVWMDGDSGDRYYYAHLESWASGLAVGQRVSRGEMLGTVGTSGNAPSHIPHLHWEFHPGGGAAVNPTPLARELCG